MEGHNLLILWIKKIVNCVIIALSMLEIGIRTMNEWQCTNTYNDATTYEMEWRGEQWEMKLKINIFNCLIVKNVMKSNYPNQSMCKFNANQIDKCIFMNNSKKWNDQKRTLYILNWCTVYLSHST